MYFKFFHIFFGMASLYFFEIFLVFEKIKSITLEAQEGAGAKMDIKCKRRLNLYV